MAMAGRSSGEKLPLLRTASDSCARWLGGRRRCLLIRGLICGRVFRSALGLQLFGVENAILSVGTFGAPLRLVFNCVGRRVSAAVFNRKNIAARDRRDLSVGAGALDWARLHVAGNAQPFAVRIIAHAAQLADG